MTVISESIENKDNYKQICKQNIWTHYCSENWMGNMSNCHDNNHANDANNNNNNKVNYI